MNRLLVFLFCLIFSINLTSAKDNLNSVSYNGNKYYLKYSEKSKEHNGYYNQYFKQNEDFDSWTEMIAVQHFPNVYSPIDLAHTFREYLEEYNCPSSLLIDEKDNVGVLDFILIDSKTENALLKLEFNVFKYIKSPYCGSVSMQYAKKYSIDDIKNLESVKKDFEKYRLKAIDKIMLITIPEVVNKDIGEIKLNDLP